MKKYQTFFLIEQILHAENYNKNINMCTQPKLFALKTAVGNSASKLETLLEKQKVREKIKEVFVVTGLKTVHPFIMDEYLDARILLLVK